MLLGVVGVGEKYLVVDFGLSFCKVFVGLGCQIGVLNGFFKYFFGCFIECVIDFVVELFDFNVVFIDQMVEVNIVVGIGFCYLVCVFFVISCLDDCLVGG